MHFSPYTIKSHINAPNKLSQIDDTSKGHLVITYFIKDINRGRDPIKGGRCYPTILKNRLNKVHQRVTKIGVRDDQTPSFGSLKAHTGHTVLANGP